MDGLWQVLAGIVLTLTATVVGVNALQSRGRDRALHGPVPGRDYLPHVRRYNSSYRPPRFQGLRSRSPRLGVGRAVIIIALILVVAMAAFFATGKLNQREASRNSTNDARIAEITQRRMDAQKATSTVTAWAIYIEAEAMLDDLVSSGRVPSDDPRIVDERNQITASIATLEQSTPLGAVQVVGGIPDAPDGIEPQIVAANGNVWLLSDAIYRVDVTSSTLVRLLQPGDPVGDATVGELRSIAWRDDRLLVIDTANAFTFDLITGTWTLEPLGDRGGIGYADIITADTYDLNLYLLDPNLGQILRFTAGLYASNPEDWTGGIEPQNLVRAVDLAVDGHVWVLREDGAVLDFFQSKLVQTIQPAVVPPLPSATALHATETSEFIHVISSDGRILRLNREGALIQIFTPANNSTLLDDTTSLTIDETSGIAYIVANGEVLTTRLPSPPAEPEQPAADPNATPGADETPGTGDGADAGAGANTEGESTETTSTP